MLDFLHGHASARKLRLFATACCRRLWDLLPEEGGRFVVWLLELECVQLAFPDLISPAMVRGGPAADNA
jgi:hypothetical protein